MKMMGTLLGSFGMVWALAGCYQVPQAYQGDFIAEGARFGFNVGSSNVRFFGKIPGEEERDGVSRLYPIIHGVDPVFENLRRGQPGLYLMPALLADELGRSVFLPGMLRSDSPFFINPYRESDTRFDAYLVLSSQKESDVPPIPGLPEGFVQGAFFSAKVIYFQLDALAAGPISALAAEDWRDSKIATFQMSPGWGRTVRMWGVSEPSNKRALRLIRPGEVRAN